ncbi:MAG: FAD-dependent oxidoreductase [Verrucomicrobiales bacterium]|nr:FAD-dependent oxidoreductase [Verrucomicrobiales bacterium]
MSAALTLAGPPSHAADAETSPTTYDLVIYGGTSAGVIAAVQAKKMGKTAVIVGPDIHLGGLSSGGLGFTDTGNKAVIGGLSRDFYHRIWLEYQKPETWQWQKQSEYGNKGQGTPAMDGENRTMWIFEPRVAEKVFEDYVKEFAIPVHRDEWLDREKGVKRENGRIVSITMLSGKTFAGRMFVDATYEGDLMAAAGVSYHVGREGKEVYGEEWNGVQTGVLHHGHHFGKLPPISPYKVPGDPASGVLPRISTEHPGEKHAGDKKVQAYCFRMCLTDHPENRIPFPKPEGYDPDQYALLLRIFEAGWRETFDKFDPIPNHKTDTNNHGPFSTDNIGYNYDYPEASYERRREIIREHETYQKGWLYFIANDPRVPKDVQDEMKKWGLPKDEFTDNGHWSHQLYIREARRMVGHYVMTEHELLKKRPTPESVGMGSYTIDSHNVQRYITPEGYVQNEGDIGVGTGGPYEIAYGSLVPKRGEGANLFVPVCVSSSHIAFGSIRMEPVFMILGQSAATAAVLAIDGNLAVQDVPYETLRKRLEADGQILTYDGPRGKAGPHGGAGRDPKTLGGIVVDDAQSKRTGAWQESGAAKSYVGFGYQHDGNARDGQASAAFSAELPKAGVYEVRLAWTPNSNRSSRVTVRIEHADGVAEATVNQRETPPLDGTFQALGTYSFATGKAATVTVTNAGADGYVVIDAVQWLPKEP